MKANRAIWSGSVSFGLVNIPVRLYSAVDDRAVKFHFLHGKDKSPVRYAKICREEEREIPYSEIVRGYEYEKGEFVVVTEEDFIRANPKKTKTIDIIDFCEEKQIDAMYYEKPDYLEPDKGADKAYSLLRQALDESGKVGISKFVLRSKENLAMIKPHGKILIAYQMRFDEEVRNPSSLHVPKTATQPRELEMALNLIEQLTKDFDPKNYRDTYTDELEAMIQAKLKGKVVRMGKAEPQGAKVHDLMALLKKSLKDPKKKANKKTG